MNRIIFLILIIFIIACSDKVEMDLAKGFAHYHKNKEIYHSISSDGIVIKGYSIDDKEIKPDLDLWVKEIQITLKSKAYVPVEQKELGLKNNLTGSYNEYWRYYNGKKYSYAVTLVKKDNRFYIVESGGLEKYYLKRKEEILKSITSLRIN